MKKFEHLLLASDIDGTFLDCHTQPVRRNLERIRYFTENGGHFTFATGRIPIAMTGIAPDIGSLLSLPAVTGNGTCLYDFSQNREIRSFPMPQEAVGDLAGYLKAHAPTCGLRASTENGFLIECVNNRFIQEDIRRFGMENIRILPQKEWRAKCYYKLALRDEQEVLCRLAPVLTERYRGVLSFAASESNILDVQCYGRNKAVMLRELADSFASPVRLIAVGDYDNDLEMLSVADLPCCPANAVEAVKKICRRCLCSNDEGAIADLIDWLDVTPDLWKAP